MGKRMMTTTAFALFAAVAIARPAARKSNINLAGYEPGSDVAPHSRIDLDQQALEACGTNFTCAEYWYTVGGNSVKGSGAIRTIQGFSTGADGKMGGQQDFLTFRNFYGDNGAYADAFIMNALTNTSIATAARKDMVKKGTAYMAVWMYVIREMEDAIDDCDAGSIVDNDDAVHAWDEAVAFYVGSLEGTAAGGNSAGKLLYRLAEKRCANYGTCTGADGVSGISTVNDKIMYWFTKGRTALQMGHCPPAVMYKNLIVQQMTVPLIQGALRYAYKLDVLDSNPGDKELGEGHTFAAAVLPMVERCRRADAETIRAYFDMSPYTSPAGAYPAGYAAVKAAFENNYECLNITCTDVGELLETNGPNVPYAGAEKCTFQIAREANTCVSLEASPTPTPNPNGFPAIAGYIPGSNVVPHAELDLDQQALEACETNFTCAQQWYTVGGNSVKGSGAIRTIQGFSTGADGKMGGQTYFLSFRNFYGDDGAYADTFIMNALTNTSIAEAARKDMVKKGTAYMAVWMYVIREMEDAIDDCDAGDITQNDDAVHAWDEAVAFYAGSLEGTAAGGNSAGKMIYRLAEKRCANYGTCTGADGVSGISAVNDKIMQLFQNGQYLLTNGHCDDAIAVKDQIVQQMTVPLIQGTLRYAYKLDVLDSNPGDKELGEGHTFAAAVLPMVERCSRSHAETIRAYFDISPYTSPAGAYPAGYAVVKAAFEANYECMNITCTDVGELLETNGPNVPYAGAEKCTFQIAREASPLPACPYTAIAGYIPGSNVVPHAELDLDQQALEACGTNFTCAQQWYTVGGNSVKGSGAIRTIQGFSTGADGKMGGQTYFLSFRNFYGDDGAYADAFIMNALTNTSIAEAARKDMVKKGTAYMAVWMYVIREMEDAIDDCDVGSITQNDDAVHAWDEAVAFYAGSLEGTAAGGNSAGKMIYRLAEKRCANYGTCTGADGVSGISAVNEKIIGMFSEGKVLLQNGQCAPAAKLKDLIVQQMTVPLIQGTLRYAYKLDVLDSDPGDKELGEGHTFAAAVLPMLERCSRVHAETVRAYFDISPYTSPAGAYPAGYAAVKAAFEANYECLNITCTDVGELLETNGPNVPYAGAEKCTFVTAAEAMAPPVCAAPTPTAVPDAPAPSPAAGWSGNKEVRLSFTIDIQLFQSHLISISNQIADDLAVPRSAVAVTSVDVTKTYELRVIITGLSDSKATAAIAALDTTAELQAVVNSAGVSGVAVQAITSAPTESTTGGGSSDDDDDHTAIIIGVVVGVVAVVAIAMAAFVMYAMRKRDKDTAVAQEVGGGQSAKHVDL